MSRKSGKTRTGGGKAFASSAAGAFGAFSTASSGTNLSYLTEPPDFSAISDANVVVSFKNLLKKDATTKAKALEDLITYVEAHPYEQDGGAEEAILEAWVQIYPRISIDNARRVRELSHSLQLELMRSARKRMERHVPKVVATWLAGTFDRDRGVSRVATDGLSSFLSTPDKLLQFWKKCQPQILDYVSDAILETADTLSDERSTNSDDAEAKYYRVLGGSLALVLNLLQKLDSDDLEKHRGSYDKVLEVDKVWTSALVNDAAVRRLSCQIVLACLQKRPDTIQDSLNLLSKVYVSEGLKSSQAGSAADFIKSLNALTTKFPTVWTSDYHGKKSPTSRLRSFLEKGSQGSAVTFWEELSQLLEKVPAGVAPTDLDGALDFMKTMRSGLTSREEPRSHAVNAWACYLGAARSFMTTSTSPDEAVRFSREAVFPLTEQYLFPVSERSTWASGCQIPVLIKAYTSTAVSPKPEIVEATKQEWSRFKSEFSTRIRNSLPEASKDHERSQKGIADEGSRWFTLCGKILEAHTKTAGTDRPIPNIPLAPSLELVSEALQLLQNRNWKPYGAAAAIEAAFKDGAQLFREKSTEVDSVLNLVGAAVPGSKDIILTSPSAPYIFSIINLLGDIPGREAEYERVWKSSVEALLNSADKAAIASALAKLLSTRRSAPLARQIPLLQTELARIAVDYASGASNAEWGVLDAAISYDALDEQTGSQLAENLAALLTKRPSPAVIKSLLLIAQKKPELLSRDESTHMTLMTGLLSLSERHDAPEVATLQALISNPSSDSSRFVDLIHQNLDSVGPTSLGIDTLVQQAAQFKAAQIDNVNPSLGLGSILPNTKIWRDELSATLNKTPNPSLSITSSLGGAYFLVAPESAESSSPVHRDRNGCSIPGRMAMYLSKLFSTGLELDTLPTEVQVDMLFYMWLTAEVASDQLTLMAEDSVWKSLAVDAAISDAEQLSSSSRKLLMSVNEDASTWREGSGSKGSVLVHGLFEKLLDESKLLTPLGLYSAKVLSEMFGDLIDQHGFPSSGEQWLAGLDILKSSPATILPAVVILTSLHEALDASKPISNFCNRLVSDAAGAKIDSDKSLATLVLLNACLQVYKPDEVPVAHNRLVFAVRQITSWLETPEEVDHRFAAEACRSLTLLLPCIKDVYGAYWERSIEFCIHLWTERTSEPLDDRLSAIHASLKLMQTLQSLDEPNDDLVDVLQSTAQKRSSALVGLLSLPRDKATQPLEIVDGIVCRQIEKLPLDHVEDPSDLYSLVAADSRTVQTAAFTLLHKALPAAQEKLAVDVLLEKKTAQLPDELLSLLLEAPTLEAYSDEALAKFPTPIRSYLLTWHLVFDAFTAAPFKVRSDYADSLKNENYVGPLMDFTFDVLGHSAANGLNLDKANFTEENIKEYDLKLADWEPEERNMQWLLIHLYYLVLKFVPGLFKSWFIDCRSKQTKIAVEGWMVKHFSPIIVSEALDDVATWAESQEPPADDEKELVVKVSRAAKEVTAGYEVDESHAAIAIKVPPSYPLEGVTVVGVNRVAVNEKKWQSWIMTTQGVITFSGGSIIDGLSAFKRNIIGALKGQTECAICYSIISSDKRMPDKRCGTCKNLFHRTCLYKWFQSSNQNTCPLCRNPIDYLGSDTKARKGV
ncbi:hypothetical protein JX266_009930 [Neoarthrinium moseri]|nr:hypothetical protein JX266_009930 [Neoarthrinium moseri]